MASISSLKIFFMFGLKTFIATFLIILSSLIFALWTWAIEAAAIGSDKSIISSKLDSPKFSIIIFSASFFEKGGNLS